MSIEKIEKRCISLQLLDQVIISCETPPVQQCLPSNESSPSPKINYPHLRSINSATMASPTFSLGIRISLKCNVHFGEVIQRKEGNGFLGLNPVSLFSL